MVDENIANDVNAKSRRTAQSRRYSVLALLIVAIGSVGGWFWLNRDQAPDVLTVATGPFGSDAYVLMREVAEVVERHSDTLRLSVKASRDASQNIAMLNRGEIDTAVIRSDTPVVSDVRVIADLYPDMMHLITLMDSGVFSVNDLQRVTVSIPEFGTDSFRSFWVLGDHYDLPIERMRWEAEPFAEGAQKLLNRDVAALFTIRSLRDAQLIRMFEDAQLKR
ncbi:MAG: TAXI family TRAP transporter solute-binding subunit, partial [Pseudomonadota bacterium]